MKCRGFCWKLIGLSALFFLFVPFLLNIVLGWHSPNNIKVIGTATDWLLFHGSYIGGVLTAVVGFVTLWFTVKSGQLESRIQAKGLYIKELEEHLVSWIGVLNFSKVDELLVSMANRNDMHEHLMEIAGKSYIELSKRLEMMANNSLSFELIYGTEESQPIGEFVKAYKRCMLFYQQNVNKIGVKVLDMKSSVFDICSAFIEFKKLEQKYDNEYVMPVQEKAMAWISREKQELDAWRKKWNLFKLGVE